MNESREHTGSSLSRIIYWILVGSAILVQGARIVLRGKGDQSTTELLGWIAIGLLIAALIIRILTRIRPRWFGNRPSREELDKY